jgi:hypothetical protein
MFGESFSEAGVCDAQKRYQNSLRAKFAEGQMAKRCLALRIVIAQ